MLSGFHFLACASAMRASQTITKEWRAAVATPLHSNDNGYSITTTAARNYDMIHLANLQV
jgi:hypothetical protein